MSYNWATPPAPAGQENLTDEIWYFDQKYMYRLTTKSRLWGHEKDEKKGYKPVKFLYYLSDNVESKFDSTKVGKQTEGKYIIRWGLLAPSVWEIIEINDEKMVLRWGYSGKGTPVTWIAKPRK
jgi:hypothetical protein